MTVSLSDGAVNASSGRLFFYLMGAESLTKVDSAVSLTLSQAAIGEDLVCGENQTRVDPEDPRCAKLTLTGELVKCAGADEDVGKAALFDRHPDMKSWPVGHNFGVYELKPTTIWMIDFYGGGALIPPKSYFAAVPSHNVPSWPPNSPLVEDAEAPDAPLAEGSDAPPAWNHRAARARWLTYNSIWGVVSTMSTKTTAGHAWGNVRSLADGVGSNSTGLPCLYLPTPDPTAIDVKADARVTISLSEAALPLRQTAKGVCGGSDPEDPTCARLHLIGSLVEMKTAAEIAQAKLELGERHPLAPWLAQGGAHTGGRYVRMRLEQLSFLDWYGGVTALSVDEYLGADPPL